MFGLNKLSGRSSADVAVIERDPPLAQVRMKAAVTSCKLSPTSSDAMMDEEMAEYIHLAEIAGVAVPDIEVEKFRAFLVGKDWPVFALNEVVSYMDDKAKKEGKLGYGWEWRPLRAKDDVAETEFGTPAQGGRSWGQSPESGRPASDYYRGPAQRTMDSQNGLGQMAASQKQQAAMQMGLGARTITIGASSRPYDKTIPIHALRKVAIVEKEYPGRVAFFVCDYALAPHIAAPDPFLMAVIPNPKVAQGIGRFVIDFWDEPGFGLEQQLK